MITIDSSAWQIMLDHARQAYPKECCGILLGSAGQEDVRHATIAVPCGNAYQGDRKDRFELDPKDQLAADRKARELGLDVLGFFHSHPDEGAYFSQTDLKHSWPWYSNVVLSIRNGEFAAAAAFRANDDQTASHPEELLWPKS